MTDGFCCLEKNFNSKSISMKNKYFDKIIHDFDFVCLTKLNYEKEINQRKNESKVITIDYYNDISENNHTEYIIFCLDKTIMIINISDSIILKYFIASYADNSIYCVSESIIQFLKKNKSDIVINYSTINQAAFINTQIPKFVESFKASNKSIDEQMKKVKKCISGYLIKKAYVNSNVNRINQLLDQAYSNSSNKNSSKDKYIFLKSYSGSSMVQLAYNIEVEKLFIIKNQFYSAEPSNLIERELNNYKNLHHQFLPRFYDDFIEDNIHYLVIEYIDGDTIDNIDLNKFRDYEIFNMLFEIMITLHHLHFQGYAYRDLKENNIIIDKYKTSILTDYDRLVKIDDKIQSGEFTGDFDSKYHAPEIDDPKLFSNKVDIYSLGLLIQNNFLLKKFSDDTLEKLKIMVEYCIKKDPKDRPTISQLIRYFYLNILYKYYKKQKIEEELIRIFEVNFKFEKMVDPDGFCTIGTIYYDGFYIDKDFEKAIHYYSIASEQDDLLSKINLYYIYFDEKYFNFEMSVLYLIEAANQNDEFSQFILGYHYCFAKLFENDKDLGIKYLERAAKQNFTFAQFNLGIFYIFNPEKKNFPKAICYLTKCLQQQDLKKYKENRFFNYKGKYIFPDWMIIIHYKFYSGSFFQNLSLFYFKLIYGMEPNMNNIYKEIFYSSKLAEQKIYSFQEFLSENKLIEKYIPYSDQFNIKALLNINNLAIIRACNYMGMFYLEKKYDSINICKAIQYFEKAANLNDSLALYYLGNIYSNKKFYHMNISKALYYYQRIETVNNSLLNEVNEYLLSMNFFFSNEYHFFFFIRHEL